MTIKIPSKKQLDEKQNFPLLAQDDYLLEVKEIEETTQENFDKTGEEEVVNVRFEILSLKDGSKAEDVEGNPAKGRKVFFTGRPNNMGFMQDGTPSKTRQFVAYLTGQDIFEELTFESWQEFKGMAINAEIIQYINKKGQKSNKIGRFIPLKKGKITNEEIPVSEDEIDPKSIPF